MVNTRAPSFAAALVRLAGAGGPDEIPSDLDGEYVGRAQELRPGSYIVVEDTPPLEAGAGFTLEAWVWPTAPGGRPQALAGCYDGTQGYALVADDVGAAALYLDGQVVAVGEPLRRRAWHHVTASYDAASGRARVVQQPLKEWPGAAERAAAEAAVEPWSPAAAPFLLAAWGNPADAHFNGKLEEPRLLDADGVLVAGWDHGGDYASEHVEDLSGGGRHGRCVNLPMRAVTGHTWCGRTTDAGQAPDDYASIWFHDDDLEDARWEPSFELRVPESLPSGAYAMRVSTADADDELPFFVRPSRGTATADIAVLMPTLSYLAYGNEHNSWANPIPATPGLDQILASVGERDRYMHEQRLKSIYELHTDGSGVAYASRLRPLVNMRSDYAMPLLLGGPHQFPADMELLEWLDSREHRYDVLTDEDLHTEGVELLASYRVLLTGSHPEYWTQEMLDALEGWLARGGRLMYLGGNGFYWVTSIFRSKPHVLEVRRGHAGTGVWRSEPGEVHHASTGEPGGLWRFRGRAPQRVAGVGFTAQGFDESLPTGEPPRAENRASRGSSTVSKTTSSACTAPFSAAPPGSRSTVSTQNSGRPRMRSCSRSRVDSATSTRRHRRTSSPLTRNRGELSAHPSARTLSSSNSRRRRCLLHGVDRLVRRAPHRRWRQCCRADNGERASTVRTCRAGGREITTTTDFLAVRRAP